MRQQLDAFLTSISQAFFDPLANFFAKPSPSASESEQKQDVQDVRDKIRDALRKEILKQTTNSALQDDGSVLLEMYHAKLPDHTPFTLFLETLQLAFSLEKLTTHALPEREKIRALLAREEMRTIIATLICAVQDVAISRPQSYYDNEAVPPDVIDILNTVLQKIEDIRTLYTLPGIPQLKECLQKLYLEIARIKGDIQLPIRSLVTAPLSLEDLDLYVRKEEEALKLAHQFIRGEGVFLIAGYRGVGKSTYLNKALTMIEDAQECQHEEYPWLVIPIFVNLAKATGVDSVLRLCIRSLYGKFSQGEGKKGPYIDLLAIEEREKIWFAYKRSIYKVNYQQEHDVTILKSGQMGVNIAIKPGKFLLKTATTGLADAGFSAGASTSKEDSNKTINIVALPDYDEDKAEDDVVEIIRLLTRPRKSTQEVKARIKLVFVFDEMDKMELECQTKVVNQLKNLFLERKTVFVLVTSKKFYYEWWKGRKVEDDVLASYFSWIKMVPLFTSQETLELLKKLIPIKEVDLQPEEKTFIEIYARYLTYNAWGVPRDIVRELLTNQRWIEDGLQPYITDQVEQYFAILVYATIQQALEDEGILSGQTSTAAVSSASSMATPGANVTIAPEHIWFNEGQREQIKRGLYLLVEEFFNQTSIEMNAKSDFFQKLYSGNFELVSPNDYERLLDRLVLKLGSTNLDIKGSLTKLYPGATAIPLFTVDPPKASGMFKKLQVSHDFYSLTGRSMSATSAEPVNDTRDMGEIEIQELLDKEGPELRKRALTALQSQPKPFSDALNAQLCSIFLTERNSDLRLKAAASVEDTACVVMFTLVRKELIERFLTAESNERLLLEFIRLVRAGVSDNAKYGSDGVEFLLKVLAKNQSNIKLSETVLVEAITALGSITNENNVLERVVQLLDRAQDISRKLLSSLKVLETNSKKQLLELLVELQFTAISRDALAFLMAGLDYKQLIETWKRVIALINRRFALSKIKLAQDILVSLLQQKDILAVTDNSNPVIAWLNNPARWSREDQDILRTAIQENSRLYYTLDKVMDEKYKERLLQAARPPENVEQTSSPSSPVPKGERREVTLSGWSVAFITVAATVMLAIYFVVPFDVPRNTTWDAQFWMRLLELGYVYGGLVALFCLLASISFLFDKTERSSLLGFIGAFIVIGAITTGCFVAQLVRYRPAFTVWGQVLLGLLLVGIIVVPVVVYLLTRRRVV